MCRPIWGQTGWVDGKPGVEVKPEAAIRVDVPIDEWGETSPVIGVSRFRQAGSPDQSPYDNHGVHIIRMRWGKVFDIDANEDSQLVAAALQIWAAHGIAEALAPPIVS